MQRRCRGDVGQEERIVLALAHAGLWARGRARGRVTVRVTVRVRVRVAWARPWVRP